MAEETISIDYQRNKVTVPLESDGQAKVVIINSNDARYIELPDHAEMNIKVHQGKVTMFEVIEKHKF